MAVLWGHPRRDGLPTRLEVVLAVSATIAIVGWISSAQTASELASRAVMHERNYQRCVTQLTNDISDLEQQRNVLRSALLDALAR